MVEKGEISSCSYKTIVQIPPFSTILGITLTFHMRYTQSTKIPTLSQHGYAPSMHSFFLSLNCSACRWREVHWVLWPTTPITPKWSLFISRNSQLRKTSPRKGRSYARDYLSDFSARPVKISTKKRNIRQIWTTVLVDGRGFDFGSDFFSSFFSSFFFSFFFFFFIFFYFFFFLA